MVTIYTVDTHSIDRSKENKPSFHKVYFLQDSLNPWKEGEIAAMKNDLQKSRFLQSQYGTFVCNSDLDEGYTSLFEFKPGDYALKWPIHIRNINLGTPKLHERRGPLATGSQILPPMNTAEILIANYEHDLLLEQGSRVFMGEWYPKNVFRFKKPPKSKK
jgi:hypothetical protein